MLKNELRADRGRQARMNPRHLLSKHSLLRSDADTQSIRLHGRERPGLHLLARCPIDCLTVVMGDTLTSSCMELSDDLWGKQGFDRRGRKGHMICMYFYFFFKNAFISSRLHTQGSNACRVNARWCNVCKNVSTGAALAERAPWQCCVGRICCLIKLISNPRDGRGRSWISLCDILRAGAESTGTCFCMWHFFFFSPSSPSSVSCGGGVQIDGFELRRGAIQTRVRRLMKSSPA